MVFHVMPAVDVAGGRLARLTADGPVPVEAFGGDPVAAAAAFVEAGAGWVHVVDVDLAFTGAASNLEAVRRIATLGVRVQAGGGLASPGAVEAVIAAGAARAVLGSAALADRGAVEALIERYGAALAIGIEAEGDRLRPRGRDVLELRVYEVLPWLADAGASRFVFTQVARVGGMAGPDIAGVAGVARATGRPVIAAGGIASLDDLRALSSVVPSPEAAIVGRALYEGRLDLRAAVAAFRASPVQDDPS